MPSYKLPAFLEKDNITRCFVCGATLDESSSTLEHLIPQWMIRMFRLEDQTVTLPSGQTVEYFNFVLPCCRECNCHLLSPIEASLARAMSYREELSTRVPDSLLAIWVCKLLAGARVYWQKLDNQAESSDRQRRFLSMGTFPRKDRAPIDEIPPGDMCLQYLRMLRRKVYFRSLMTNFPFSLFTFRTKVPARMSERFDFKIISDLDAMYLRMGRCCVLARSDGGYISIYGSDLFYPYQGKKLAPLQAEELAAHFFTMAARQKYPLLFVKRREGRQEMVEFINIPLRQPFAPIEGEADFIRWFSIMSRVPENRLTDGHSRRTFLIDEKGNILNIPANRKDCFGPKALAQDPEIGAL